MNGPLPVAPVVDRLGAQAPLLRYVGNAANLATALKQKPTVVPAAYVVRQERAEPSAGASGGVLIQQMRVDVIVVVFVRNHSAEASGAAAARDMDAVLGQVRAALLNWRPDADADPISMNASRDEGYASGQLVAQEFYRSRYRIQVQP